MTAGKITFDRSTEDIEFSNDLDTRGIPFDMDPHRFYDDRPAILAAQTSGVERLAYMIFGNSTIRSFAFALDPFSPFSLSPVHISPVTRTRRKTLPAVKVVSNFNSFSEISGNGATPLNPHPPAGSTVTQSSSSSTGSPIAQGTWFSKDTTRRTRPAGVNEGEFELFQFEVDSPARSVIKTSKSMITLNGGSYYQFTEQHSRSTNTKSPGAHWSASQQNAIAPILKSMATSAMSAKGASLLARCLPTSRSMDTFRAAAEARELFLDLKESVRLVAEATKNLSHRTLSKAFLNEQFGWAATFSDLQNLLKKPAKVAKSVNYLLRRRGLATTFRHQFKWTEAVSGLSGASIDLIDVINENNRSQTNTARHDVILRMMTNATVSFPHVELPNFRQDLYLEKLGVNPRPIDVYNLTPWTWLFDWFTGFDDYIRAIDAINFDSSTINFGFITYLSTGYVNSQYVWDTTNHDQHGSPSPVADIQTKVHNVYSARLGWSYEYRKDVADILEVSTVANPINLSALQTAILGALISFKSSRISKRQALKGISSREIENIKDVKFLDTSG